MKLYDSVVIGGGPAGMTAALYLVRSGATIAWVEKLAPGGQILMTETIDNYPGFPKGIKGYELVDAMAAHLDNFSFDKFNDEVKTIESESGKHQIMVGDQWIEAKAVLICTGASFKRLDLPKEEQFTGRGVSYCAICDGAFFKEQVIAVVGGGDAAGLREDLPHLRVACDAAAAAGPLAFARPRAGYCLPGCG
jgi:thioredoxin reductase (NADPH)